jgi:hypothetical protein
MDSYLQAYVVGKRLHSWNCVSLLAASIIL